MKYLKFSSPETKIKWYLIKIYLKVFSKKNNYKNIKLIVEKKSEKLNLINIVLKNNKIGQMVFLKKMKNYQINLKKKYLKLGLKKSNLYITADFGKISDKRFLSRGLLDLHFKVIKSIIGPRGTIVVPTYIKLM